MNNSIDKVTGLPLTTHDLGDIVKRLCFFAPTGSGAYLRDLLEYLALQAMSMLPSAQLSARDIHNKLIEVIGARFEYEEVLDALARLVAKASIQCDKERAQDADSRFRLDIAIRNQMREQVNNEANLERETLREWQGQLRKKYPKLPSPDIDQLTSDLKIFAFRLLSQHSAETLEVYYGSDSALARLLQQLEARDISDLWESKPAEFSAIRMQEVTGFFLEADDKRKQYIASLMHSLFILQLTHLDPQCAAIVRSQISPAKVFLDTNFIFRLVGLQGPDFFLAARKLSELSQNLGFQLVVSPQTISEYDHTLAEFLKEIKGRPIVTSDLAELALAATNDEDFITAYWRRLKEQRLYINPTTFYEYYRYLVPILKDQNVAVDDTFCDEVWSRDADLASEETLLREVMQSHNMRAADRVSTYVLRHDVFHRLLIMRYRKGLSHEIFADAKAWFLTCDTKLAPYDRIARNKQGIREKLPFCVTSGQWIQTLRPFSSKNGDLDIAQVDMIVSPLFRAYQRPPSHLINNVISRLASSTSYSLPAVGAMLSDRQFLEQFDNTRDDAIAQQDVIDNYFASYADEMEAKAKHLEQEVSKTKMALEEQSQKAAMEAERRQRIEADLQNKTQTVAQLQASQQTLANSFKDAQAQAEHEKDEQKRIHETELQKLKEENRVQSQRLRKRAGFGLLLFAVVVVLAFLRQTIQNSPISIWEFIGALSFGLYLGYVVILDFWRTRTGVIVSVVSPLAFVISLFLPTEITNVIQVAAILIGGVVTVSLYIQQSTSRAPVSGISSQNGKSR